MDHVIRIHQTGSADVLKYESQEVPQPKSGEVLLRQTAIGLNFIDVYFGEFILLFKDVIKAPGFKNKLCYLD